ncbi:MAG: MBL fold metallo-hydrolase, partial [Gemmatimonadales bacterium]
DSDFINMRGSQVMATTDPASIGLDSQAHIAVVCARGNDSKVVTAMLVERGYHAKSVIGGMAGWMHALAQRNLTCPRSLDHLIQFDRVGKGALGYLLVSDGQALIVDPPRHFESYLAAAADCGAQVIGVAETHVHADYISGGPRLTEELGVPYYVHDADSSYPYDGTPGKLEYTPVEDGSVIDLGRATITVFHNPGHTLGSVSYLIDGEVALTGDFIFVKSLGRPDLGGKSDEWTGDLWRSLERAKQEWAADTMIFPAHYSSADERMPDHAVGGLLADLLVSNQPLTIANEVAFRAWVDSRASSFPPQYRTIKGVNILIFDVDESEADTLDVGKNECAVA